MSSTRSYFDLTPCSPQELASRRTRQRLAAFSSFRAMNAALIALAPLPKPIRQKILQTRAVQHAWFEMETLKLQLDRQETSFKFVSFKEHLYVLCCIRFVTHFLAYEQPPINFPRAVAAPNRIMHTPGPRGFHYLRLGLDRCYHDELWLRCEWPYLSSWAQRLSTPVPGSAPRWKTTKELSQSRSTDCQDPEKS